MRSSLQRAIVAVMRRYHALLLGLLTCVLLNGPAQARDDRQFETVPELDTFFKLSDRFRVFTMASTTRSVSEGTSDGEVGAYLDVLQLRPIIREALRGRDLERNQYLWARVGFAFAGIHEGLLLSNGYSEKRFVGELTGRYPMSSDFWLVVRLRTDFRDLEGTRSNRYRVRFAIEKEYTVFGKMAVPYARAEFSYDTRFESWSRQLYQVGVEVELWERFRVEPYYAFQVDTRTTPDRLDRVGFILKYYR